MTGYIHSLQSLGTVDGPGVRAVVFASGCPLRCIYCHNPDTHKLKDGTPTDLGELVRKIERLYPYIKDGGVTFSGGEPLMQAEFFSELADGLHALGLHVALDTSGCILDGAARKLLSKVDLVLLDLKFTSEEEYKHYTGSSLIATLDFLRECERLGLPVWIRQVIVPGLNDTKENILRLKALISPFSCIEKTELLPFKKLCLEKYKALGIPFPLANTPELSSEKLKELSILL